MTDRLTAEDAARLPLFHAGSFILASGGNANWKIECDALTPEDWAGLAVMLNEHLPAFGSVEGVPRGGIPLADALRPYVSVGPRLVVDDVWTTGGSMRAYLAAHGGPSAIGGVAFARGPVEPWVTPLFTLAAALADHKDCVSRGDLLRGYIPADVARAECAAEVTRLREALVAARDELARWGWGRTVHSLIDIDAALAEGSDVLPECPTCGGNGAIGTAERDCADSWHSCRSDVLPTATCSLDGCGFTFSHFHRDTLDGEEVVRIADVLPTQGE